jgi:hypothetical protein
MRELKSGLFFFAFSLFVLWESLRAGLGTFHKPGSGFLSFCAGVILAAFSLMLVYQGWGLRKSEKPLSLRVIFALASLFVYSLVLETLGFMIATFLLVGIFFRLGERRRWWVLLGMSASVALLTYLIFGVLLHVYFPRGFLGI